MLIARIASNARASENGTAALHRYTFTPGGLQSPRLAGESDGEARDPFGGRPEARPHGATPDFCGFSAPRNKRCFEL